jgi:hypothetical protein
MEKSNAKTEPSLPCVKYPRYKRTPNRRTSRVGTTQVTLRETKGSFRCGTEKLPLRSASKVAIRSQVCFMQAIPFSCQDSNKAKVPCNLSSNRLFIRRFFSFELPIPHPA